ncbi:MAG TPA: diaminopimelate decarboxylase [Thermoanaerobaculia bacterium]|nr:diaminopimelate decarboxylase [Thermoanaerobaculia bacterium]
MTGFSREDGALACDGVALSAIAREVGTPAYVYSGALIAENYRRFDDAFADVRHLVCYAAKANSNLALLRRLAELGAGADVVSGGELRAVLSSGFPADRVVFSGVGKTDEEIRFAVENELLAINSESEREIEKIEAAAARAGVRARVALRVNPDIDARSHPYISTGRRHNKFGVEIGRAREIFSRARRLEHVRMTGVQAHIGSQILDPEPLAQSARDLAGLAVALASDGHPIETVDAGGGIGIAGEGPEALTPERYAAAVLPHFRDLAFKILIEPGRAIVGPAGTLLTKVLYVKENSGRLFVITDAGMNDLLRPALYGAIHSVESVSDGRTGRDRVTADVVGPICETSDFFLRDSVMDLPAEGELLAIRDVGAYGFSMSSNYNFRRRPPEVWVEGGSFRIIRRRETFEDIVREERE